MTIHERGDDEGLLTGSSPRLQVIKRRKKGGSSGERQHPGSLPSLLPQHRGKAKDGDSEQHCCDHGHSTGGGRNETEL